jgi:hypothetical protein
MRTYCVSVNRDHYLVNSDDNLTGWKAAVVDAVRQGGNFVEMTNAAGVATALLITSATMIAVQEIDLVSVHGPAPLDELSHFDDL